MSINNYVKTIHLKLTTELFWVLNLHAICKYLKTKFGVFDIVFDFTDEAHLWIGRNHANQPVNIFEWIHHSLDYSDIPADQATLKSCNTKIKESYNRWHDSFPGEYHRLKDVTCENLWFNIIYNTHRDISDLIQYDMELPFKEKIFTCFMGNPRMHRLMTYMYLHDMDLLSKSYTTFLTEGTHINDFFKNISRIIDTSGLPLTLPNSTETDFQTLETHTPELDEIFIQAHTDSYFDIITETTMGNLGFISENDFTEHNQIIDAFSGPDWWQTEFFTEKLIRSLYYKRPFMLLGAKNQLQTLRDLGFKTFEYFWNEDYDKENNWLKRIMMVLCQSRDIANMDKEKIHTLFMNKQMQGIVEHNKHRLHQLIENEDFFISLEERHFFETNELTFNDNNEMLLCTGPLLKIEQEIQQYTDTKFYRGVGGFVNKDCNIITPWV